MTGPILVIGAHGQLGTALMDALMHAGAPAIGCSHKECDIENSDHVRAQLKKYRPSAVINTAAYHHVDHCETNQERAFAVNAASVARLAVACAHTESCLVHISTDYVFGDDERRNTPYCEDDRPGPLSVYGASKLAGEHLVRSYTEQHFIVRTAGLYRHGGSRLKGGNFVETMLRLQAEGQPINVVADQIHTPTYAPDLARAIVELLQTQAFGTYHLTNEGRCSWFDFAAAAFEFAGVAPQAFQKTTAAEFGAPARRPAYSVLNNAKAYAAGVPKMRHWSEALGAYFVDRREC